MSLPARVLPAPPAPRPALWSRRLPALIDSPLLLIAYAILAVLLFSPAWAAPFTRVIGDGPDPPVFMWYLRWVPFAVSHGMNPLLTNYLDYPDGINLMWQTSVPLLGLLLWPVTATLGPVFAYNLLMTASLAASAWCGFLAFRRHVTQPWAAAVGGLLFGFSPYMLAQSQGHPHVGVTFLLPLLLMALEDAVIHQRRAPWRQGLVIGGLAAAQLLISEELLLTEALGAVVAIVILAWLRPELVRARLRYAAITLIVAAGALTVIAAVPLWIQFFGPQAVRGTLPTRNVFVSDLAGFVLPTSLQALAPPSLTSLADRFGGTQYEAGAYLGIPLLLALIAGTVRWWRLPVVQVSAMLALLTGALSLGLTLHVAGLATGIPAGVLALGFLLLIRTRAGRLTPAIFVLLWIGLALLPILDNVVASRLVVYVSLFVALLGAVFLDQLSSNSLRLTLHPPLLRLHLPPPLWGRVGVGGLVVLVALTLLPRLPFPSSPVPMPGYFSSGAPSIADGDVVLVVPYAHNFESRAMLWQMASGMRFRMPEGYANRPGPSLDPAPTGIGAVLTAARYGVAPPPVTPGLRASALAELRHWQVRTVILGPMAGQDRVMTFLSGVIGAQPSERGGVYIWRVAD